MCAWWGLRAEGCGFESRQRRQERSDHLSLQSFHRENMDINASVDIGKNLTGLIEKLAAQIGTTADKVYPWYVQQAYLEGVTTLVTIAIVIPILSITFALAVRSKLWSGQYENQPTVAFFVSGVIPETNARSGGCTVSACQWGYLLDGICPGFHATGYELSDYGFRPAFGLAFFAFFGATCGDGGVPNMRRNTASSVGVFSCFALLMDLSHG